MRLIEEVTNKKLMMNTNSYAIEMLLALSV